MFACSRKYCEVLILREMTAKSTWNWMWRFFSPFQSISSLSSAVVLQLINCVETNISDYTIGISSLDLWILDLWLRIQRKKSLLDCIDLVKFFYLFTETDKKVLLPQYAGFDRSLVMFTKSQAVYPYLALKLFSLLFCFYWGTIIIISIVPAENMLVSFCQLTFISESLVAHNERTVGNHLGKFLNHVYSCINCILSNYATLNLRQDK